MPLSLRRGMPVWTHKHVGSNKIDALGVSLLDIANADKQAVTGFWCVR